MKNFKAKIRGALNLTMKDLRAFKCRSSVKIEINPVLSKFHLAMTLKNDSGKYLNLIKRCKTWVRKSKDLRYLNIIYNTCLWFLWLFDYRLVNFVNWVCEKVFVLYFIEVLRVVGKSWDFVWTKLWFLLGRGQGGGSGLVDCW